MYGSGIEEGINDTAVGLNAVLGGYYTRMSCEGHDDKGNNAYPWVGFDVQEAAQLGALQKLLEEFYADREVEPELRLGFYDDFGGLSSGRHSLVAAIGHEARTAPYTTHEAYEDMIDQTEEWLDDQQQEMADFAAFLKTKFLGDFEIEVPESLTGVQPD